MTMKLRDKYKRQLIGQGALKGCVKESLHYKCKECSRIVTMVWKTKNYKSVRVAYCDCIAYKSHVDLIPKDAESWTKEVQKQRAFNLYSVDSGFDCPFCRHRVRIVDGQSKPYVKGAYCKCVNWVGHVTRLPSDAEQWRIMLIETTKEGPTI